MEESSAGVARMSRQRHTRQDRKTQSGPTRRTDETCPSASVRLVSVTATGGFPSSSPDGQFYGVDSGSWACSAQLRQLCTSSSAKDKQEEGDSTFLGSGVPKLRASHRAMLLASHWYGFGPTHAGATLYPTHAAARSRRGSCHGSTSPSSWGGGRRGKREDAAETAAPRPIPLAKAREEDAGPAWQLDELAEDHGNYWRGR